MKAFTFKTHKTVPLEIAGQQFRLLLTDATALTLRDWGACAQRLSEEVQQPGLTPDQCLEKLQEAWDCTASSLDALLGKGATARIFADRAHNLEDITDVMTYVSDVFAESQALRADASTAMRADVRAAPQTEKLSTAPLATQDNAPFAAPPLDLQAALRVLENPTVMQAIADAVKPVQK